MSRRPFISSLCVPAIAGVLSLWAGVLHAAPAEWLSEPYEYMVLDQDVRTALTEFGRNIGVTVSLSDAVKGKVHGRLDAQDAGGFLDALSRTNGLVWYFDGAVLHVSAASEYATRVISAGRLKADAITREMQDLNLIDQRFDLRGAGDGSVITVSGPPAYVAMVAQLVQTMQPAPTVQGDDPRVRVYRGGRAVEVVSDAHPTTQP